MQSEHRSAVRSGPAWGQLGLVLLPVVAFYGLLVRFYTAVPLIDDYWHMIAFALQWHRVGSGAGSAAARLSLVMNTQVGPYKLLLLHAFLGLQLALTGRLHFPLMILLGNGTLLGIFALLWRSTPRDTWAKYPTLVLLPVSLLLFSLNYAETVDWAVSGLQQPGVVLFSLAAVYFLVQPSRDAGKEPGTGKAGIGRFALACVCGLLASATYANGALVWPVGLLFLLMQGRQRGWPWVRLPVWCACFAATLFVYLRHSQGSGVSPHVAVGQQIVFLLSFCGGGLENMHHRPVPYLSLVLGLGVVAAVVLAVRTRYDRRNPYFFYSMLWLGLTAVVVANARVAMGLQLALSGRYKIYCDLLLVFCYEVGLDWFRQRSAVRGTPPPRLYLRYAILASSLFCVGSDVAGGQFLLTRQQRADAAMRAYLAAPGTASPMFLVEDTLGPSEVQQEDLARQELNDAREAGIYTPPAADRLGFF